MRTLDALVRPHPRRRRHRPLPAPVPRPGASATSRKARRKDHLRAVTKLTARRRRPTPLRRGSADARAPRRHRATTWTRSRAMVDDYRESLDRRPPLPVRPLPTGRRRPQGGRGRQRRDPVLDRAVRGHPTTPSGDHIVLQVKEAQPSVLEPYVGRVGARAPGPPGRRRPAPHPGGQRHLPRLDARRPAPVATTTCASCGT